MLGRVYEDRRMAEISYVISYLLLHSFGDDVTGNFKSMGVLGIVKNEFLQMFSHTLEIGVLEDKMRKEYKEVNGSLENCVMPEKKGMVEDLYD